MTIPRQSSRAFTLIEVLVVIAIIAVLIALLLPAVQSAREASRRITCRANLKQLGLAVLNYHDSHRALPASGIVGSVSEPGGYAKFRPVTGRRFSWAVLILPFIEEQALYDQFDRTKNVMDQPREPQQTQLPVLRCPSDPASESLFVDATGMAGNKRFAKGNYAAYTSPYHVEYQNWYPGALIGHRRQTLKQIEDGTSNTIVLAEIRSLDVPADQRGAWAIAWVGSSLLALDSHPDPTITVDGRPSPRFRYIKGTPMQMPNQLENPDPTATISDTLFNCSGQHKALASTEHMPCMWVPGAGFFSASPRSLHPGGVHAVLLDGHVTFISDDISEPAMASLVSINDGQIVPYSSQ